MLKKHLFLSSAAMLLLMTSAAHASQPLSMEEMQKQIEMLSQQVEKLSSVVEAQGKLITAQKAELQTQGDKVSQQSQTLDKVAVMQMAAVAPAAGNNDNSVKVTMNQGLKVESADGKYTFQPFGRVHLDATIFADDARDQPSNANFRRARLGFKGNLGEDFNYKAEVDFGLEAVNLKEVYLAYTGFKPAELLIGNFKPPVGLEQNTSSNYMEFIELAPVSAAFTRDEIIGAAFRSGGENWSLSGGVFNEDPGTNNNTATAKDEGVSLDAHASVDVLRGIPDALHVGFGGSIRKPNRGGAAPDTVTLSAKPAGTGPNMITTGAIGNVDRSYTYGPELAGVFGPVSLQSEYMVYTADVDGAPNPTFKGWYAQASYFLTGESRPYKGKTGNFDRVKPKAPFSLADGGSGAWEILARYDLLDLNDNGAGVTGGEMRDWTLGLNWYLKDNIRLMFNYIDVNTDDNAVVADDDPQVYNMRAQFDF